MIDASIRGERRIWTVGALIHAVGDALAERFASCAVRGELSGFSRAASGHCYFGLKDADGEVGLIRCAMFRRAASLLDFTPADGAEVEVRGRLAVYEPRGELQFVVESMRRSGAGTLFEQFLRLKARLEAEGLFDPTRKRALPRFPSRIGVVTSLGAAALHDVLTSLARRAPHVAVVVYPTLVQGKDAPAGIASAIAQAAARDEVDLLIVCRGGGSLEDLWAFNDEVTVRAVAGSPIPTIAGVGHETDLTLVDFAADLRAATPTAAAELATPGQRDNLALLQTFAARLGRRVRDVLDRRAQTLDNHALRLSRPSDALRRQDRALSRLGQRMVGAAHALARRRASPLDTAALRLQRAPQALFARHVHRLDMLAGRLQALDPHRVLRRGYAWVEGEGGRPVQSVTALSPGDPLRLVLVDGVADLEVTGTHVGTNVGTRVGG